MLYYPIQEDDRATGILMPMYGVVARDRIVDQQRVLLGDQPQPGRDVLSRLDVLARQRRSAPNIATCSARRRRATSATTGSTRTKRSSTARRASRGRASRCAATSVRTCRSGCRRAARVDYFTDVTVQQTYNHNFYNASNSTRSYERRRVRRVAQPVDERHVPTHRDRSQRLDDSTVSGQTPGFTAAFSGVRLGPLPLFGSGQRRSGRNVLI